MGDAVGGRAGLLVNARSRLGLRAEDAAADALRRGGLELVRSVRVAHPKHLAQEADKLLALGLDRLIVGGGDGTISTVAPRLARRGPALGVLPLGTANDFARTLQIPSKLEDAAEIAAGGHTLDVDLARANDAFFLNVASIGMSVAAMNLLSPAMKKHLGPIAYMVAAARAFFGHDIFRFRLQGVDVHEGMAHQVVVANGRFYGGGVLVAQDSSLDDGALTAYCLGTRGRWELLRTVALMKMRVPLDQPGDAYVRTNSLRVETWPSLPVNLDGEIRTQTPVEFTVEAKALRVLVPKP